MKSYTVYTVWPEEHIREAVTTFNEQMRDGADVENIRAGLRCLEFLLMKSKVSPDLQSRIDGCIVEANMRIDLLLELERKSYEDSIASTIAAVESIGKVARSILRNARTGVYGEYMDPC